MNTVQSKREIRRQKLLDVAKHLFATRGFAGTTVDDIAAQADVAKVTFYSYFGSKENLALEIKREGMVEALQYIEDLKKRDLPVEAMIEAFVNDVVEWTDKNRRLLDVFCDQRFSPLLERETDAECKPEPVAICLDIIIQRGQDSGKFRKNIDRIQIAQLVELAMLCEQYHWVRSGDSPQKLSDRLMQCFDFALNGILQR